MMRKIIYCVALSIATAWGATSTAQNQIDALRYSTLNYSGTARFSAMGGAFTSLGSDYSGISINPAGLGVYRSSEMTITPTFLFGGTNSTYENAQFEEGRLNFNLGNIAYVSYIAQNNSGWKNVNWSIGYSRTNNFAKEYFYESRRPSTESLINSYVNQLNNTYDGSSYIAQNQITSSFPANIGLAYEAYLIDSIAGGGYDERFYEASNIDRSFRVVERGGIGDFNFSVAGNYNDKLYIGGSIGVTNVRYIEETTYKERMTYNTVQDSLEKVNFPRSTDFTRTSDLQVNGSGINLKFGLIYRLMDNIRLGASIQSPTYLGLSETYTADISSNFIDNSSEEYEYVSEFSYRINTPWRTNFGVGYILGKKAIISVDYEYVNYSKAKIKDDLDAEVKYGFKSENESIKRDFAKAHNVRFGTEYRLNDPYSLRFGFQYNDNPLASNINDNLSTRTYSAGIGYRNENGFFLDASYSLMEANRNEYLEEISSKATINQRNHFIQFTLGVRY